MRRRIAALAAVLALAAAACGSDGRSSRPSPSATPAVTPGLGSPSPAAATPAGSGAPAPPTASATVPPASVAPGRPISADPPAATAPKPGSYRYRATTDGRSSESVLRIADRGDGRQVEELAGVSTDVIWKSDGKYNLKTRFGQPPQGFECDWKPDFVEVRLPLTRTTAWSVDTRCDAATTTARLTIRLTGSAKVQGAERVKVAGRDVDVWVVAFEGRFNFRSAQGTFTQNVTSVDRFSPAHGLTVLARETTEGTDQSGQSRRATTTRELLNLDPA